MTSGEVYFSHTSIDSQSNIDKTYPTNSLGGLAYHIRKSINSENSRRILGILFPNDLDLKPQLTEQLYKNLIIKKIDDFKEDDLGHKYGKPSTTLELTYEFQFDKENINYELEKKLKQTILVTTITNTLFFLPTCSIYFNLEKNHSKKSSPSTSDFMKKIIYEPIDLKKSSPSTSDFMKKIIYESIDFLNIQQNEGNTLTIPKKDPSSLFSDFYDMIEKTKHYHSKKIELNKEPIQFERTQKMYSLNYYKEVVQILNDKYYPTFVKNIHKKVQELKHY